MSITSIRVSNLVKRFKYFTLSIPSLTLWRGINLIIGPNGSGKSTLLKLLAGFLNPDEGRIHYLINGKKLSPYDMVRDIGYVAEDLLLPNLKVSEILDSFTINTNRTDELISLLGLTPYLNKRYMELSAGFRKRVQIALAVMRNPSTLLLDEPFSNVDLLMIPILRKLLLKKWVNKTVILTSHLSTEIIPTYLVILNQGKIIYSGRPEDLKLGKEVITVEHDGKTIQLSIDEFNKLLSKEGLNLKVRNTYVNDLMHLLNKLIKNNKNKDSTN